MTEANKARVKMNCALDRLSELPNSLVFEIFQFLDVTDVVRTTILSKRWKDLWTTFPYLDFNDSDMMIDTDKIRNFIDGVVNSWRGIKIVKFSIEFREYDELLLDSWVRFATERKVEELKLLLPMKFVVPQCLYSCSSLQDLCLSDCDLHVDGGNVQWYSLKKLFIFGEVVSENAINQVMSGSPHLETFYLSFHNIKGNLSIRSTSLRSLTILMLPNEGDARPELRIWTPNLEYLGIAGIPHSKCLLIDVSSLTKVALLICGPPDVLGETLSGIFPSIKHVQTVILSDLCIKAIGAMKDKHMLSPFPNAKELEINVCSEEYEQIVGVLDMFPNLRKLVLQSPNEPNHAERSLKFSSDLPNLFLQHLGTVDVTLTIGDHSVFPFIQFLLKYASNLVKMVVFWRDNGDGDEWAASWKSLASQKLLQMERSSPSANLIFY